MFRGVGHDFLHLLHGNQIGVGMSPGEIDHVILVGGSTRIPRIREILNQVFPSKILQLVILFSLVLLPSILAAS